jgi:hypothetical protein
VPAISFNAASLRAKAKYSHRERLTTHPAKIRNHAGVAVWPFGGHHVALHYAIIGGEVAVSFRADLRHRNLRTIGFSGTYSARKRP